MAQGLKLAIFYHYPFRARNVISPFRVTERCQPVKPESHLRAGRNLFQSTESTENFTNPRTREEQSMSELKGDAEGENRRKEQKERNKKEDEMKMLVSKLEDLKGPALEIPEYKDAYKADLHFFATIRSYLND